MYLKMFSLGLVLLAITACSNPAIAPPINNFPRFIHPMQGGNTNVATADLFLVAGQSNAWGAGDPAGAPQTTISEMQVWNAEQACFTPQSVANSSCNYGSFLPAFAKSWHQRTGRTAYFVQTAVNGSGLVLPPTGQTTTWNVLNGQLLFNAITALNIAHDWMQRNSVTANFQGILWSQGETDAIYIAAGQLAMTDYHLSLIALIDRWHTIFPGSEFGIIQTGSYESQSSAGFLVVRTYQTLVCATIADTKMLYSNTLNFPALGWMQADNMHYSQAGLNDIGTTAALKW